jgi:hypothetical protein
MRHQVAAEGCRIELRKLLGVEMSDTAAQSKGMAQAVAAAMRSMCAKAIAPIVESIAALRKDVDSINKAHSITAEDVALSLAPAVKSWELDFERRAQDLLIRAMENAPKPKDGKDALGFDNLSFEQIDERNAVFRFSLGDSIKEFPVKLAAFLDRGVWDVDADSYLKGDGVSWRGSFFIAQKDGPEGEPGTSQDWRLAVKRGRDGRETVRIAQAPRPVRIAQ